jgi:hypothetical protein
MEAISRQQSIGEEVRFVGKVFTVFVHHAVQVRRPHCEDPVCLSAQLAGELQGLMFARVNAPPSEHLLRSITIPSPNPAEMVFYPTKIKSPPARFDEGLACFCFRDVGPAPDLFAFLDKMLIRI